MKRVVYGEDSRVGSFVMDRLGAEWYDGIGPAIGLEDTDTGELLGGVVFENCNGVNCFFHIASNGSARWGSKQFIQAVFHYVFEELGCKRVTGMVESTNLVAVKLNQGLGLEVEAVLFDACPDGHIYVFRMFREQCRWLKGENQNG